MSRLLCRNKSIELLEPYEGKLSRTVLRGERGSNVPDLPDFIKEKYTPELHKDDMSFFEPLFRASLQRASVPEAHVLPLPDQDDKGA